MNEESPEKIRYPYPPPDEPPEPAWLFYILSFLIPLGGLILGAIFLSKPDRANKEFGKHCLIATLAALGLCVMLYVCYFLFILGYVATVFAIVGAGLGLGMGKAAGIMLFLL